MDQGWFNLKKLDVPINKIKTIFLTHDHWDHTGGLFNVLEKNSNLKVILPYSFSEKFKQEIESRVEIIEVKKKKKLFDNIYSTGEFKKNHCEQALILNTQQGYVLVTGCSHPGLESFLKISIQINKPHALIGGLHNFSNMKLLSQFQKIGACHCTKEMSKIKKLFAPKHLPVRVGDKFDFNLYGAK